MDKKGQVAWFFVVGLVLIITFLLISYLTRFSLQEKPPERIVRDVVPERLAVLSNVVEGCLQDVSKPVIKNVLLRGGLADPSSQITVPNAPSQNAVEVFPGFVVPLWSYVPGSVSVCRSEPCTYEVHVPSLELGDDSLRSLMAKDIKQHFLSCVDDLSSLDGVYDIVDIGDPLVEVYFNEYSVDVGLIYPVEIRTDGNIDVVRNFVVTLDAGVKPLYDAANTILREIAHRNDSNPFVEYTNTVIDLFSAGTNPTIPPRGGGVTFERSQGVWLQTLVAVELNGFVSDNMYFMDVIGANRRPYYYDENNSFSSALYPRIIDNPLVSADDSLSRIDVSFLHFPSFGLQSHVSPSRGQLIMPDFVFDFSLLGLLSLHAENLDFTYDVSYPVVVHLVDDYSFGGEGLDLYFAFEVNDLGGVPLVPEANITLSPPVENDVIFADRYFVDPEFSVTNDIRIVTSDAWTQQVVPGVAVSFACGEESVPLGQSDEQGKLTVRLPQCVNGALIGEKDSYFFNDYALTTYDGLATQIDLIGETPRDVRIHVLKRPYLLTGGGVHFFGDQSQFIEDDDRVLLIISKEDDTRAYVRTLHLTELNDGIATIDLVSGSYAVDIILLRDYNATHNLTIPGVEVCSPDWNPFDGGDCDVTDPLVINSTFVFGGASLQNVEISREAIATEWLSFFTTAIDSALLASQNLEALEFIGEYTELSETNRTYFLPVAGTQDS
ncbi:MAG: hypothetical protein H6502_05585 [Candidatus Woesearchaeota archaeon]|nr:MAG: hypothetical protein H6502_05585 [Candidatus Woesearchaeota archaeon]